ncbi:LCP family protein [bacterium]|nr:LCP family protein [bacterium]
MKKIHIVLLVVLILAFAGVITAGIVLDNSEKAKQKKYFSAEIAGKKYRQKTLTTFLLMGLDKEGYITKTDSYVNDQQCDFVAVLSFDYQKREYTVLQFNRDSMVSIEKLGLKSVRTNDFVIAQIALAHTWGTGLEDSCENARRCVSKLLYNLEIDYYISFTMDAIKEVVNFISNETGIPVTFDKDYTDINPAYTEGNTLYLDGDASMDFVRARLNAEDGTNISRMSRQKLYMNSFLNYIQKTEEENRDVDYTALYKRIHKDSYEESVVFTDCPANVIASLFDDIDDFTMKSMDTPLGEADYSKEYVEFYIDQTSLDNLAIDFYFTEVKD